MVFTRGEPCKSISRILRGDLSFGASSPGLLMEIPSQLPFTSFTNDSSASSARYYSRECVCPLCTGASGERGRVPPQGNVAGCREKGVSQSPDQNFDSRGWHLQYAPGLSCRTFEYLREEGPESKRRNLPWFKSTLRDGDVAQAGLPGNGLKWFGGGGTLSRHPLIPSRPATQSKGGSMPRHLRNSALPGAAEPDSLRYQENTDSSGLRFAGPYPQFLFPVGPKNAARLSVSVKSPRHAPDAAVRA